MTAAVYIVITCGSIAVAAFFMSLVGRAFLILAVRAGTPIAGARDACSCRHVASLPLAVLASCSA